MKRSMAWLAGMVVGVVVAGSGWADTVVTTNTGAWDGPVWTPHAPNAGDVAVLKHNLTLSNATVALAACTNTAGTTLTFSTTNAVLNATALWVDGTLTHNVESATTTNTQGQWIKDNGISIVCADCTVSANGKIDVSAKGYQSPTNSGGGTGYGPGGGVGPGTGSGGGGYGGKGGTANKAGGTYYGSAQWPVDPGSGGGTYNNDMQANIGGGGGGLVTIQATNVTVNGSITANGGNTSGSGSWAGGGSGGGIAISCITFAGSNGILSAFGGNGGLGTFQCGGGGGGRISIQYNAAAQAALVTPPTGITLLVNAGVQVNPGRPGTLFLPDTALLSSSAFQGGQLLGGASSWAVGILNLSSNNAVAVFTNGFQLTVGNDLLCSGARSGVEMSNGVLNIGGALMITNGGNGLFYNCAVTISSNLGLALGTFTTFAADTNGVTLRVGGDLAANSTVLNSYCAPTCIFTNNIAGNIVLTNSTKWYVYSGMTNSGTPYYGALVSAGGDFVLSTNCWIYPYSHATNGGSPTFRAKNLTIATNAGFFANGSGFSNNFTTGYGYGPGGGRGLSASSGGGYGGVGGRSASYAGGTNYGSAMYPIYPGSAGGIYGSGWWGGYGGGLVRIEAPQGRVTVNGTIRVDGIDGNSTVGGGGAGGGIYILCRRFAGLNGLLSAKGGNAPGTWNSLQNGGGGGGRIAVWRAVDESSGISSNIAGGTTSNSLPSGQVGTFYWGLIPSQGLLFLVR